VNEEALAHWGLLCKNKQTNTIYITEFFYNEGFFILLFTTEPPPPQKKEKIREDIGTYPENFSNV